MFAKQRQINVARNIPRERSSERNPATIGTMTGFWTSCKEKNPKCKNQIPKFQINAINLKKNANSCK